MAANDRTSQPYNIFCLCYRAGRLEFEAGILFVLSLRAANPWDLRSGTC